MLKKNQKKQPVRKQNEYIIWDDDDWRVVTGRLVPPPGRPRKGKSLFEHVAEKIPFDALSAVHNEFKEQGWRKEGIYIAHDSMGVPRYAGRGQVFYRLAHRYRAHRHELKYFSFYMVTSKKHEREIETLIIKICGPFLAFNDRKKREGIAIGSVYDFEAGTRFVERRKKRGKR